MTKFCGAGNKQGRPRHGGRAKGQSPRPATPSAEEIQALLASEGRVSEDTAALIKARHGIPIGTEYIVGMKPATVMDFVMKHYMDTSDFAAAVMVAKELAPYVHPRLATETHTVIHDDSKRSTADLERELAELEASEEAANQARAVAQKMPNGPHRLVH